MSSKTLRALTLIELMITLAIVIIILSLAIATMRGYIPKQRLVSSTGVLENTLQQAQTEANARSYWTCVQFDTSTTPTSVQIRVDTANAHGTSDACTSSTLLNTTKFKKEVEIATGSGCTYNITSSCVIWFNTKGSPKICADSGSCGGVTPSSGCADFSFQIVLSTPNLEPMARSREVEVLGMIQTVKPTEKGLVTTLYARAPGTTSDGCE